MKAFWIAYLISKNEQFFKILQKIVTESPTVIRDPQIHQITGEPQKVFNTFIELEKNPGGMALWIHLFQCIESLGDFGFFILRKSEVIPEIEQNDIFVNTPVNKNRRVIRHKLISISPYRTAQWFRISFDEDTVNISILSEPLPTILLPPITKSDAITYLIIKPNNGLMWYPIAKNAHPTHG